MLTVGITSGVTLCKPIARQGAWLPVGARGRLGVVPLGDAADGRAGKGLGICVWCVVDSGAPKLVCLRVAACRSLAVAAIAAPAGILSSSAWLVTASSAQDKVCHDAEYDEQREYDADNQ